MLPKGALCCAQWTLSTGRLIYPRRVPFEICSRCSAANPLTASSTYFGIVGRKPRS